MIASPRATAQRYRPLNDSIVIERITIQRPDNYLPGDILIPSTYAAELERAADSLKSLQPRYDSLVREVSSLYLQVNQHRQQADSIYRAQDDQRERIMNELLDLGADVVDSQGLLFQDIKRARQRQRQLAKDKRSGFLRELLYHPTTTPAGRVLVGGLVVSFSALTIVSIISLAN